MQTITFTTPDDWHSHLRSHHYLARTVPDTCRYFKRAIIMPNLSPPIVSITDAVNYRSAILSHVPSHHTFTPLMTLYLTDTLTADDIKEAKMSGIITALKLYPKGATTHSQYGVADIRTITPVLEAMQKYGLPLLIHGELVDNIDIFERETLFIETVLIPLIARFPELKIVLEHISTRDAVTFIESAPPQVAATITAHHLLLNRNDLLSGGLKPHHYCLPIVKREEDRQTLIRAATSGHKKFFLGTDSAPHARTSKETACGCAGIYTAFHAIPLYLDIFEQQGALHLFERFASINGPTFYGLPINGEQVTFIKKPWSIPETLSFGSDEVIPLFAGNLLQWQLSTDERSLS